MGVNEQINRIKNAVAAIKTAIAGKGVSVPTETLVDGLADYIDEIEQIDVSGADVSAGDVLSGKKFVGSSGVTQTGSMPNNGSVSPSALAAGGSYTIPAGYHSGSGKVTAKSLAEQTDGTAAAGDVLYGKTAYVDGVKVTGSMTDQGTKTATLDTSTKSYTIPAGKHSGSGKVSITTQEKSVTPSTSAQTVTPDSGKVLSKVSVSAVASATQATPSISVAAGGMITASATQEEGYVAAGTKQAKHQLPVQGATVITPSDSIQTAVSAGTYCIGDIRVAAASGGKRVLSGTVTNAAGKRSISITLGDSSLTLSSNDTFLIFATNNSSDSNSYPISSAIKSPSRTSMTYVYPDINEDGSMYADFKSVSSPNITFALNQVTIDSNSNSQRFGGATYVWYAIVG